MRHARQVDQRIRIDARTVAPFKCVAIGTLLRPQIEFEIEPVGARELIARKDDRAYAIVGVARKPVELPRLRFSVRDAQGAEIYAWNAILEQPVLNPGERAWFKSRLASPPPEGRNIDVRFFSKRDIAGGNV